MFQNLFKTCVVTTMLFCAPIAVKANQMSPLPSIITTQWPLELVGQSRLRKFGFHIYDASYWIKSGNIEAIQDPYLSVLCITYARHIAADRLLSSTEQEWTRLGFANKHPLQTWLASLKTIWPSVDKGDQLIVVSTLNGETLFFDQDKQLGSIQDPNFGPAFLAIWLDENSRYKKNRKELLGE